MKRTLLAFAFVCCAAPASAQSSFSYANFERDPTNYAAAHYPGDEVGRGLRADLQTFGFTCYDAVGAADGAVVVCDRMLQTSAQCFTQARVTIYADSVNVERRPRCMGVIAPRGR